MHDVLYAHQDALGLDDLLATRATWASTSIGSRRAAVATHALRVARDVESADESGVAGTPTFFINGRRHYGAYDLDSLTAAVPCRTAPGRPSEVTSLVQPFESRPPTWDSYGPRESPQALSQCRQQFPTKGKAKMGLRTRPGPGGELVAAQGPHSKGTGTTMRTAHGSPAQLATRRRRRHNGPTQRARHRYNDCAPRSPAARLHCSRSPVRRESSSLTVARSPLLDDSCQGRVAWRHRRRPPARGRGWGSGWPSSRIMRRAVAVCRKSCSRAPRRDAVG